MTGITVLASEARSLWMRSAGESAALPGVRASQETLRGLSLTAVEITDERGAAVLGKPRGHYYTLRLPERFSRGDGAFSDAARAVAALLGRCLPGARAGGVLVAALGNPDVTPDALGSLCAGNVLVTRHLCRQEPESFRGFCPVSLCRPGVLGTTGVESAAQIRALCRDLSPACVIAVDALAGSEPGELCRSVQICDSGIAPGSGVGNDREVLDRDFLGVPVIAVGVPTVADVSDEGGAFFVTPRYIDSAVRSLARLIGYGINLALHEHITIEDIDLLLG